jgi:uncharacterized protein with GYD domain
VVDKIKQLKGVNRAFAVLGRFDVVADVEAEDDSALADLILRMGKLAGVIFTETLVQIQYKGEYNHID